MGLGTANQIALFTICYASLKFIYDFGSRQRDQIDRMFVQYFAIYNNENSLITCKICQI